MDKLAVIIVNWNTGKLLAQCLQSLLTPGNRVVLTKIIVVDNASTDTSIAQAQTIVAQQSATSAVDFILSPSNLGFAKANNRGLEQLGENHQSVPHVFFLNPDTVVPDGTLLHLVDFLKDHPQAGIVGPQLRNPDGSWQPSVRQLPTLATLLILLLKLPRIWPQIGVWRRYLQVDFDRQREQIVEQVMGAAFLVKDRVLQQLPAWDEHYFVWFEEVDFCARVRAAGWEVWYTPTVSVTHYGGISFNQLIGWARVRPWLNSLRTYAQQHLGLVATLVIMLLSPVALLLSLPASIGHIFIKQTNEEHL